MIYALVMNLQPLISVFLGVTFLKEKLAWREALLMGVSLIAVLLVVLGANESANPDDQAGTEWWMWVILFMNPILKSVGTISLRTVKKMHESVVSCWLNLAQMLIYVPVTYIMGKDLTIVTNFNGVDWILLLCVGSLAILA